VTKTDDRDTPKLCRNEEKERAMGNRSIKHKIARSEKRGSRNKAWYVCEDELGVFKGRLQAQLNIETSGRTRKRPKNSKARRQRQSEINSQGGTTLRADINLETEIWRERS